MNTQESIVLRLTGTDVPPGEIALSDLASIAGALQLLTTRIGRQLVGQTGPGRTGGGAERATRLTLTGISEGSTRLQVTAGAADTLALDDPFEEQVMNRLWEVFAGLETDLPPDWATAQVAQAAVEFVGSVGAATRECEFTGHRGQQRRARIVVRRLKVTREVWARLSAEPERVPQAAVTGDLDFMDLRTRKFRVRDAVGNDVVLEDVANAAEAATLVGQRGPGRRHRCAWGARADRQARRAAGQPGRYACSVAGPRASRPGCHLHRRVGTQPRRRIRRRRR